MVPALVGVDQPPVKTFLEEEEEEEGDPLISIVHTSGRPTDRPTLCRYVVLI